MNKPQPLWVLSLASVVWVVGCMSVLFLGALAGLSPKTLQPVKSLNALGLWVWIYLMTSPVARWKGRRGWPWFLLGTATMWGGLVATVALAAACGAALGGPKAVAASVAAGLVLGFPVGIACTTVLGALLRRSAPLPGAPCLLESAGGSVAGPAPGASSR